MAEKITLARPYARAAFAYAQERNALAAWASVLTAMGTVVADARVHKLIGNPNVVPAQLLDFIVDVASKAGAGNIDEHVLNFLKELVHNGRLALLPEIAAMFEVMRNDAENVADVQITSAIPLDDAQRQRMTAALKKRLQKDVRLHCDVDAGLIGGAVIRSGDMVIDGSLRTRLAALSGAMAG